MTKMEYARTCSQEENLVFSHDINGYIAEDNVALVEHGTSLFLPDSRVH